MRKEIETLELQEVITERLTELETIREAAQDFVNLAESDIGFKADHATTYLAFENLKELVN